MYKAKTFKTTKQRLNSDVCSYLLISAIKLRIINNSCIHLPTHCKCVSHTIFFCQISLPETTVLNDQRCPSK